MLFRPVWERMSAQTIARINNSYYKAISTDGSTNKRVQNSFTRTIRLRRYASSTIITKGSFEDGMSGLQMTDIVQQCAPWGNVCIFYGTKYVPVGIPSIVGSLILFVPALVLFKRVRELERENFRLKEERNSIGKNEWMNENRMSVYIRI